MTLRLGAYVLMGDPEWLRSSLSRYYDHLDDLVLLVPDGGLGWNGKVLPVDQCLSAVQQVDKRGISRVVTGSWSHPANPRSAELAQRQTGVEALHGCDWVIQIDNDEVLPDFSMVKDVICTAAPDVVGVEWPMRVLYRRLRDRKTFLAVSSVKGSPVFEYPGPIVVRPSVRLSDARRLEDSSGFVLRYLVEGDEDSLQVRQPPATQERREALLRPSDAILHNSWGRSPMETWRKVRTSGHASKFGGVRYFAATWLPSTWRWRRMRNFHPFADQLWPRLSPLAVDARLLIKDDL